MIEEEIEIGKGTKYILSLEVYGAGDADSDDAINKIHNLLGDRLNCPHKLKVIDTTPIRFDCYDTDQLL